MSSTDVPLARNRPTHLRHFVLAALLVITAINYAQRNAIAPAATTIEQNLPITRESLDLAMGAFFVAYLLLQVPSGWLAQRWGPRLTLSLYAAGWSLSLALCALASGFLELYLGRFIMGAFQAGIFPCATLILQVWYPATQRGLATALLNSFMLLGSAGGSMIAGPLLEPLGWRGVFLAYAVPGLLWAVWFLWWFRNHPSQHPGVNQAELDLLPANNRALVSTPPKEALHEERTCLEPQESSSLVRPAGGITSAPSPASWTPPKDSPPLVRTWLLILTSVPLLLLCTQQAFRAAASRLFDSRLPTYLEEQRGQTKEEAAELSSYPQLAGIFGGLAGGALSDYILRRTGKRRLARNGVAVLSLVSATAVYLAAWFIADATLAVLVLSAGYFLFSASAPCSYALSIDIGGKHLAIVFGLMNMVGNMGSAAFVSNFMRVVALGGWQLALGVWLLLPVLTCICWFFLNPNVVIGEPAPLRPSE